MAEWSRATTDLTISESMNAQPDAHNHIPSSDCYRFTWGDYAALSYVWGDETNTRTIFVDGHEMEVTQNLEEALQAFCSQSEFQSSFKLWVDAICINQRDNEERGRQVRRMREIYGHAWTVIAWLGGEHQGSTQAIQLVQDLSERTHCGNELEARLWEDPGYLGTGSWRALNQLMERQYWCRLWIIQEIVMGASAMVIRCGTSSIDWTSFCAGIGLLQENLWIVKNKILKHEGQTGKGWSTASLHLVYRDLSVLSQHDSGHISLAFWRILDIASFAECRDPRDKVYGLVGLMESHITSRVSPDYNLPPSAVYTEIARSFIQAYANLEPIREGNPWGPTNTPSWVADWRWQGRRPLARIENHLWGPSWLSGKATQEASAHIPYQASGQSKCEVTFSDALLLTCTGCIVDSISALSARGWGYFNWDVRTITQDDQWTSWYGSDTETSKALYRTLVADRVGRGQRSSEHHSAILNLPSTFGAAQPQFTALGWTWLAAQEEYYFRWESWRGANRNFRVGHKRLHDYFSDQIPSDASEYDFTEVYSCFDRTSQKRRFMLTNNGFMGWAPDNVFGPPDAQTEAGDLIAILFSCSTPIVIRPHGEYFKVVGEAYVQGLMDGEAMELLESGKAKSRSLTFC
jgi:hypothetical protein